MAGGWLTNDMVEISPVTQNGTLTSIVALVNNGVVVTEGAAPVYTQLNGYERLPVDTQLTAGGNPQTIAAATFHTAALYFAMANSAASATAGAATLNTVCGTITSEALTTAAGATYTLTLTNSTVTATARVHAAAFLKSATTGGPLQITSVTASAGSLVIVVTNKHATAVLNGTIAILFQVANAV